MTAHATRFTGAALFAATTLTLALPADVYADAYASAITISVVSAP